MTGRIQALEFDRLSDFYDVACANPTIHVWNTGLCIPVCNDFCTSGVNDTLVTTRMITVFVCVENLCNYPTSLRRGSETFLVVQWVDCESVTRFRTGDQVVEVAIRITRPDLFDDH
jgi:hypothetical protein